MRRSSSGHTTEPVTPEGATGSGAQGDASARQAAELLLVPDEAVLVEEALFDAEDDAVDEPADVDVDDFAAGLLLDDEPRLSFR
ncbi:hypothetical protein GCM10018779_63740 [Streptomyces griseocarneus]|nr:hypothetical protein GCM10018779_63740 [Streptomyces griseocarneus]